MRLYLVLFISLFYGSISAQDFYYAKYDWKAKPDTYELTPEELAKDEVVLMEKRCVQLLPEGENLYEYNLTHRIVRLNNDKAIERYNKYYVSNRGAIKVVTQKARVIKPNGKVIELSQSDIKEAKDENGNVDYQYFAFEGIEIGSYIEYMDIIAYPPTLSGDVISLQTSSLKKNVEVDIITPKHIEYQLYCVNGLKDFVLDTTALFVRRMVLKLDKLEPLVNEAWSAYDANLKKCFYKFYKNTNSNKANFYNYSVVSQNIHERMFAPLTKKEASLVNKFIQKAKANEDVSKEEKVRRLENLMKKEISVIDGKFENSEDITFLLNKKVTSEDGLTKLMLNCLRQLGMTPELVVTCNRNELKFTTAFEGYNFLREFLIYVKDIDKYWSYNILTRVGFPSEDFTNCEGLFISEVKIGEMVTGVGKVKYIKGTDASLSVDIINTKVSFEPDFTATKVDLERITTGYKAMPYQAVIDLLDEERRKELKEDYLNYLDPETKVENIVYENDKSDDLGNKPFTGRGTINSTHFVEKGGNNFLFKVGMLIGPQSELYNKEPRKLPVETGYARRYERRIEVTIPEGYVLKNAENLMMEVKPDATLGFTSTYKIEGNKLIVIVTEWYNTIYYPVEDYVKYEKVINAAADFNKIVILFQPK